MNSFKNQLIFILKYSYPTYRENSKDLNWEKYFTKEDTTEMGLSLGINAHNKVLFSNDKLSSNGNDINSDDTQHSKRQKKERSNEEARHSMEIRNFLKEIKHFTMNDQIKKFYRKIPIREVTIKVFDKHRDILYEYLDHLSDEFHHYRRTLHLELDGQKRSAKSRICKRDVIRVSQLFYFLFQQNQELFQSVIDGMKK